MAGLVGRGLQLPFSSFLGVQDNGQLAVTSTYIANTTEDFDSCYVSGTITVEGGIMIFKKDLIITSTGLITASGGNATGLVAGTGSISKITGGGGNGGAGAIASISPTSGTAGSSPPENANFGGTGGTGGDSPRGAAGGTTNYATDYEFQLQHGLIERFVAGAINNHSILAGGAGGGGGGNTGYSNGGGGGGGGGGIVWIMADTIWIDAGGSIVSNGGNGGNAPLTGTSASGGGGGGGGGGIILICNHFINQGTSNIKCLGGAAGLGQSNLALYPANDGQDGGSGVVMVVTPKGLFYESGTLSAITAF